MNNLKKKKLGMFTLYNEKGGSSKYRAYIYKSNLEKDYEVFWFNFWSEKYVTKYRHNRKKYFFLIALEYVKNIFQRSFQLWHTAKKCDVIFLQKDIIPKMRWSTVIPRYLKKKGVRILFDVDDAIYVDHSDYSSNIASLSDCVLCGNQTLITHYKKYNQHCVFVPTVEDVKDYIPFWNDTYSAKVIGWIGSQTTVDNLELVVEPINKVISRHPEVSFHIISNSALDFTDRIMNAKLVEWDSKTYIQEISKFTVGIMPLYNNERNQGKCGFKLIQYLNMKKPVIASDVGVNKDIVDQNGFIVHNEDEWVDALETLLFNPIKYRNCVEMIEEKYFEIYDFQKVYRIIVRCINAEY